LGADGDREGKHSEIFWRDKSGLVSHPKMIKCREGITGLEIKTQVAKIGENPILVPEEPGRPDLAGFMPETRRIGAQSTLPLKIQGFAVGRPGPGHAFIDSAHFRRWKSG
jgi:hypothetical protein